MNKVLLGLTVAAFACGSFAAGNDTSEKGVPRSSLKIFSGGAAVGAMAPVSKTFKESCEDDAFFGASLIGSWQFRDNVALFVDASWFMPGENGGLDFGIDYLFSTSSVRPFAGGGVGLYHLYSGFGPSLTAHIGIALDVTETAQVRLRAPYRFMFTKNKDQGFGLDLGVMFTDRFSKIKKLNY